MSETAFGDYNPGDVLAPRAPRHGGSAFGPLDPSSRKSATALPFSRAGATPQDVGPGTYDPIPRWSRGPEAVLVGRPYVAPRQDAGERGPGSVTLPDRISDTANIGTMLVTLTGSSSPWNR